MPSLTISQPLANAVEPQSFVVAGQVSDSGLPEPHSIDSVTVQVDGGAMIDAKLTSISTKPQTIVGFQAPTAVTGGARHTVTVRATNDIGVSVQKTVTFFTGAPVQVAAPAVQIEISPTIDTTDPAIKAKLDFMVSQVQMQLIPLSKLLASNGQTLAGPNLVIATDSMGAKVLRIGLWIVGPSFSVVGPQLPDFPLPRLSDGDATASFDAVPFLARPATSGLQLFAYAISVPTTTLQKIVDAVFPMLRTAASPAGLSLQSAMVVCTRPDKVATTLIGQFGVPSATITATITETLSTIPVPGTMPAQMVPAVKDSVATGTDVLTQSIFSVFSPIFLGEAIAITVAAPIVIHLLADKPAAVAGQIVSSLPSSIPFRNTVSANVPLPNFPMIFLNWNLFGATEMGIVARGTLSILDRDASMVALTMTGDTGIVGYQSDLAGGAAASYGLAWSNLLPEPDQVVWQTTGKTGSDGGPVDLNPKGQGGSFSANFALPDQVKPGLYHFNLSASASETSGKDPSQKLTASANLSVNVDVVKDSPSGGSGSAF